MKRKIKKIVNTKTYYSLVLVLLLILLVFSFFACISIGSVKINISTTYKVVIGKMFKIDSLITGISNAKQAIIWNIRVPRVILGIIAGAGLALCGCIMQSTVNNPISEPYILGVSSGATFGATLIIALGLSYAVSIGAFIGALMATALLLLIACKNKKMTATRLILSGTVINALFSAFANFIISVFASSDSIMTIKFWTMGSLANAKWDNIIFPLILVIGSIIFFITQGRILNVMMLGDETASTLGINLTIYRILYLVLISIITGVLVASCGVIGFIGLVIPHVSRSFIGTNHKRLIPIVVILGALFLVWADVLARILVKNADLPIGIFTALVGAPFFIYIVTKRNYGKE